MGGSLLRAEQQPAKFTVIELATGADLGTYENEAEVAACLAFSRLSADDVEIATNMSGQWRDTPPGADARWGRLRRAHSRWGLAPDPLQGTGQHARAGPPGRLPRIRRVRAAEGVQEAIRCSDPTECRRTIYDRTGSTMILPRPRLMM